MANRSSDFNYKVALASGLKSLQGKRMRQAEEQFRYLIQHFPAAEGGYRGLAKVLLAQEDRAGAQKVLLEGGAALAKAMQREGAIAVYKEAVQLDPRDLAAHRRLASSLALAGDIEAAAHEYVRYIREVGDAERAQLEAQYALERMPHNSEIEAAASAVGAAPIQHVEAEHAASPAAMDERAALMRSAFGAAAPAPEPAPPPAPVSDASASQWRVTPEPAELENEMQQRALDDAWKATANEAWGAEPTGPAPADTNGEPISADVDSTVVEATAARYLAKADPRGATAALEVARRYIADGRIDAASDILLQLIAAGIAGHEAQRLLVEVTKTMGKSDLANAKVKLLVEALKLDGHAEQAAEVEQQAQGD